MTNLKNIIKTNDVTTFVELSKYTTLEDHEEIIDLFNGYTEDYAIYDDVDQIMDELNENDFFKDTNIFTIRNVMESLTTISLNGDEYIFDNYGRYEGYQTLADIIDRFVSIDDLMEQLN